MTSPVLLHAIELTEFEKVVPRGVSKQTWAVRLDRGWVQAAKVPGATIIASPGRAGVVWERRVQLVLAAGTCLRLIGEDPQRAPRKDVFSIITLDPRAATRIRRVEYRLSAAGTLDRRDK
jgi:hypothetical protein